MLAEARGPQPPTAVARRSSAAARVRPLPVDGLPLGLGALKPLEDGGGLVLRAYEPQGARGAATLTLPGGWQADAGLDLLEVETGAPSYAFGPFAVRSWRLTAR